LLIIGVGTAFPLLALFDPGSLSTYGVEDPETDVLVLLQHRGVLQAVLGTALVYAAFRPAARVPVAIAAITTKSAGFAIAFDHGESPPAVTLVFDTLSLVVLGAVLVTTVLRGRPAGAAAAAR
jgi:hypothetical protein